MKNVKKINKFDIAIISIIIAIIVIDQISKIIIQKVGNINIEQNTYSISEEDPNSGMMYIVTNLIIILAILIAIVVYILLILVLKVFSEKEIKMLPGGQILLNILKFLKVY